MIKRKKMLSFVRVNILLLFCLVFFPLFSIRVCLYILMPRKLSALSFGAKH